jgi:hypothetical protein
MPPMTAVPLGRQSRATIRPSKRAQAMRRRRQNQLPKTRLSTNVRRATRPTPSQRPHGRAPAPPKFSGIRQSARQHAKIHTASIRQRMRPQFGSGQSNTATIGFGGPMLPDGRGSRMPMGDATSFQLETSFQQVSGWPSGSRLCAAIAKSLEKQPFTLTQSTEMTSGLT